MLNELLDAYWHAAYAEGAEGRNHDTEDGIAQKTLSAIQKEVANLIEQAHMAGQYNAGVDPSYSEALAYRNSLDGI
jgi:hypothetical protein